MLIETNLDTSQELINYFTNIQEINDKYFNEINIFTDQVSPFSLRATKYRNT